MQNPSDNPFLVNKSVLRKEAEEDTRLARERQRVEEDNRKRERKTVLQAELAHIKSTLTRKQRERDMLLLEKDTHLRTRDRLHKTANETVSKKGEQREKERAIQTLQTELNRIHGEKEKLADKKESIDQTLKGLANDVGSAFSAHGTSSRGRNSVEDAKKAVLALEKEAQEIEKQKIKNEHELSLARTHLVRVVEEEKSEGQQKKEDKASRRLAEGKEKRAKVAQSELTAALARLEEKEKTILAKIATAQQAVDDDARAHKENEEARSEASEKERREGTVLQQQERKEEILAREIDDMKEKITEIERELRTL